MDESVTGIVFIILAFAGVGAAIYGQVSRFRQLLNRWAGEHQYDVVDAQVRPFLKGPFMWSGKNQVVYRVHVRDEQGIERTGWVRCGDWFLGVLADKVEAKWDTD